MKEITSIQQENPLPNQSVTTRAIAEGLSDPLEIMAERNVDFKEVGLLPPTVIPVKGRRRKGNDLHTLLKKS